MHPSGLFFSCARWVGAPPRQLGSSSSSSPAEWFGSVSARIYSDEVFLGGPGGARWLGLAWLGFVFWFLFGHLAASFVLLKTNVVHLRIHVFAFV